MAAMTPYSPPDGTYEPPTEAAKAEVQLFGLSDFDIKLVAGLSERDGELSFEVIPDHFSEDCYTITLAALLDERVEDNSTGGIPTPETVEEVVALLEQEIASLRSRMAARINPAA
jgi:hypothetical protein